MPTIAVLSLKGGVGKSTVTLGLAGAAWLRGLKVLVIDADPQANSTSALDPGPFVFTLNDVLADGRPGIAAEAVVPSGWGSSVHLIASERALSHREMKGAASPTALRNSLDGVSQRYDLVLIDCPPALGELTRNALAAADAALVVTEPGFFAVQGAAQAIDAIEVARPAINLRLRLSGIVVNRVRASLNEHKFRLDELKSVYGDALLEPYIPERSAVQQAQGAGVPIQAWPSPGAHEIVDACDDLLDHVLER